MKKKFLMFICLFFLFFCFDLNKAEAANNKCSNDLKNVKSAYACDYSGSKKDIGESWSTSFSLIVVEYGNNQYCSMLGNSEFAYNDNNPLPPDSSFKVSSSKIRNVIHFNMDYKKVIDDMSNGNCPDTTAIADNIDWNLHSFKRFVINAYSYDSGYLYDSRIIYDIKGSNLRKLDQSQVEEILKEANMTNEQVIEAIENWANKGYSFDPDVDDPIEGNCSEILTPSVAKLLNNLFFILSVVGIILLIILSMTDFVGAITSDEDGAVGKAFKKSKGRVLAVVILLLLPTFVNWSVNFLNNHMYIDEESHIKIGSLNECFNK